MLLPLGIILLIFISLLTNTRNLICKSSSNGGGRAGGSWRLGMFSAVMYIYIYVHTRRLSNLLFVVPHFLSLWYSYVIFFFPHPSRNGSITCRSPMASFLFGALNGVSAFSFRFVGAYIYMGFSTFNRCLP